MKYLVLPILKYTFNIILSLYIISVVILEIAYEAIWHLELSKKSIKEKIKKDQSENELRVKDVPHCSAIIHEELYIESKYNSYLHYIWNVPKKKCYKVIITDAYNRETVSDILYIDNLTEKAARSMVKRKNNKLSENTDIWYMAVPTERKLHIYNPNDLI